MQLVYYKLGKPSILKFAVQQMLFKTLGLWSSQKFVKKRLSANFRAIVAFLAASIIPAQTHVNLSENWTGG